MSLLSFIQRNLPVGWHEDDIIPFANYSLRQIKDAYQELAERVADRKDPTEKNRLGGKSEIIRKAILSQGASFTLREITEEFKTISPQLVKKVLYQLKEEGRVTLSGRGRGARWEVKRAS